MSDKLLVFEVSEKVLLCVGVVCVVYGIFNNYGGFVVAGLSILGFAVFWRSRVKALKSEIEILSVMGDEFACALKEGRDISSATTRALAKLGLLRTEIPQYDFRDQVEEVKVSISEVIAAESRVLVSPRKPAEKILLDAIELPANEALGSVGLPFTYLESESALFGPDGEFLKHLYCPKALDWNQLIADDPEGRSRGCSYCSKRVINLDVLDPSDVVQALKTNPKQCVFGTEKSVRFLHDPKRPPLPKVSKGMTPVVIHTARTVLDINRGASFGYWPDVRLVSYDTDQLGSDLMVYQNVKTGLIDLGGGIWFGRDHDPQWKEVISLKWFYQYFQENPIAAYLVPKKLPAGTPVLVLDPIEDILGEDSGDGMYRASNVKGVWDGEKINLDISSVKVIHALG